MDWYRLACDMLKPIIKVPDYNKKEEIMALYIKIVSIIFSKLYSFCKNLVV